MSLKLGDFRTLACILIIFVGTMNISMGQELQEAIDAGKSEYIRSCALCHGDNGKGNGIYASKLIVRPTNLSLLQKQNNGIFPTREIYKTIEGRDNIKAHGPKAMPIWGDRFDHESLFIYSFAPITCSVSASA